MPLSPTVFGDLGWMSLALSFSYGALDAYFEAFAPNPKLCQSPRQPVQLSRAPLSQILRTWESPQGA